MTAQKSIDQAIEIQQKCITRYLKNYPLSKKSERGKMKIAIEEIKQECPAGLQVMFPHTPDPIDIWIDRANVERAKMDVVDEPEEGFLF